MVKQTSVILYQQIEFVGDSEDDVEVVGGQEFALPGRQPSFTSLGLALRAVPVATRIVGDRLISALGTSIEVASERGGAAVLKSSEGFELLEIKTRSIPVEEALALHAEDIGHLHGGPFHGFFLR